MGAVDVDLLMGDVLEGIMSSKDELFAAISSGMILWLIQRKRIHALFNFDYQIECYVPEAKRRYGYYSLPILWDGKFVARMDCKAERKKSLLHILHLALEPGLIKTEDFAQALSKELEAFMRFNDCYKLQLHRTTPANFKSELQNTINSLTS